MLSSGMRRHTFFFVRKRGYTLHIDAPDGGTKMETEKVYAMPFAKIYPIWSEFIPVTPISTSILVCKYPYIQASVLSP